MAQVRRIYLGRRMGRITFKIKSSLINQQSVVIITASEGDEANTTASPARFVGHAPIGVENIAPFDGSVIFRIYVIWDEPLPVWADIFIADELPRGFIFAR